MKILVTGATGTVGAEVVKLLQQKNMPLKRAVRKAEEAGKDGITEKVVFDFLKPETYRETLKDVDRIFLVRPPQLADPKKEMLPFIIAAKDAGVQHVVFLSLQGVEMNPFVPHRKIEKYLRNSGMAWTMLRPSFFMQNLSMFYAEDIGKRNEIFVPAGKGKTSFIDVRDIAAVAVLAFENPKLRNNSYTLTGSQALTYYEAAEILSEVLGRKIEYKRPSAGEFKKRLRAQGVAEDFISVMSMIYFFARIGLAGKITADTEQLLQRKPISMKQFAEDYKQVFNQP